MTQNDVAVKLGVTYQAVSKWERDENLPDATLLQQLSQMYDVSVDNLLNGELTSNGKRKKPKPIVSRKKERLQKIIYPICAFIFLILIFVYGQYQISPIVFLLGFALIEFLDK